ncbi:MAG: hypothetical protein JWR25_923 [Noviherbaspirillum sp.]|nr:hypothetical protein [Noviherbaspirillum sp.]
MRENGVVLPKYSLRDQVKQVGDLTIQDGRDDGVNRVVKTARLTYDDYRGKRMDILYEPHIVWMNERRFTLQGFERVPSAGRITEYAQSWLCSAELAEEPNEK